jgi:hypothetical protein
MLIICNASWKKNHGLCSVLKTKNSTSGQVLSIKNNFPSRLRRICKNIGEILTKNCFLFFEDNFWTIFSEIFLIFNLDFSDICLDFPFALESIMSAVCRYYKPRTKNSMLIWFTIFEVID